MRADKLVLVASMLRFGDPFRDHHTVVDVNAWLIDDEYTRTVGDPRNRRSMASARLPIRTSETSVGTPVVSAADLARSSTLSMLGHPSNIMISMRFILSVVSQ
ncbi:hypothetical protein LZC95_48695 [Pendulispora brunnea]|uniref:Uncharacterized protein n=1 Tax=Pendulispora brunnea TaxID=2905690 RepID=A0ABZ2KAC0_9BACT